MDFDVLDLDEEDFDVLDLDKEDLDEEDIDGEDLEVDDEGEDGFVPCGLRINASNGREK